MKESCMMSMRKYTANEMIAIRGTPYNERAQTTFQQLNYVCIK